MIERNKLRDAACTTVVRSGDLVEAMVVAREEPVVTVRLVRLQEAQEIAFEILQKINAAVVEATTPVQLAAMAPK